jgi:replicative DNA helicase
MRRGLYQSAELIANADLIQKPQSASVKPMKVKEVVKLRLEDRELEKLAPSTGYPTLDQLIKGFVPGRLYTLTGDTNSGKTALACNFAHNVTCQTKTVLYFALEPDRALVEYLASIEYECPFSEISKEQLLAYDTDHIDIYGADQVNTIQGLIAAVETNKRYDLVIVDHIGYFVKSNTSNYYVEQGNVLKQLALLAQRCQTAIMLIAHLNKQANVGVDHWIPNMNQISGTGAFKQDSDDVIILARKPEKIMDLDDALTFSDEGLIFINKTKAGKNGVVPVNFMPCGAKIYVKGSQFATSEGDF